MGAISASAETDSRTLPTSACANPRVTAWPANIWARPGPKWTTEILPPSTVISEPFGFWVLVIVMGADSDGNVRLCEPVVGSPFPVTIATGRNTSTLGAGATVARAGATSVVTENATIGAIRFIRDSVDRQALAFDSAAEVDLASDSGPL